jgi:hypothetical protein
MPTNTATDQLTDIDMHAIVEHCLAHGDESLPQGVLAHASRDQLDHVANMLDAGGFHVDADGLRRFVRVRERVA